MDNEVADSLFQMTTDADEPPTTRAFLAAYGK